jgi:DNA-binding beta-propeller fold protein YncE
MKYSIALSAALLLALSLPAQVPEIPYDSAPNLLKLPAGLYLGEVAGVALNSRGNIFVYTRTGGVAATTGASRNILHGGSRLFEFDATGKYLREIGQGLYGFVFAQAVRVDSQDNIWAVDRGSNLVVKFSPDGRLQMTMGRKPEAVEMAAPRGGRGGPTGAPAPGRGPGRGLAGVGTPGDSFSRPTDVAFDAAGNIFVSDANANARVAKFDRNGKFLKSFGSRGTEPGQFDTPNSLALDARGNLYVADLGNKRIQVFDNDGNFKTQFTGTGAPWAICISPGAHQYLYSSNSNAANSMDNGEIFKMELDGRILGKFGRAGTLPKEFGAVNQIECRSTNELYVGEQTNWRVQKLTLRPTQ